MVDTNAVTSVRTLLKTALAKPYHYRRNGLYYLRMRPRNVLTDSFTVSLRTTDKTTAMDISKDILKALAVFHLDNVEATWAELKPRLLDIAKEALESAHGDDSLWAYSMVYEELKASLSQAAARNALTVDQHKALQMGRAVLTAAQERLQGEPQSLPSLIEDLNDSDPVDSQTLDHPSLSVSTPQVTHQVAPKTTPKAGPNGPLSWEVLAGLYMDEHRINLKPTTLSSTVSHHKGLNAAFLAIGLLDLKEHTRADLVALRTQLLTTRKPSTVNTMLTMLQTVLEWGVNNDYLTKAYTARLKLTKGTDSDREAFTRDQVETLMARLGTYGADSWRRWGVSILAITGARVGEVSQLTREDIKEVDGQWCIHIHEEGEDRTVKNKHSTRLVPLIDGALGFDLKEFLKAVEAGALPSENGESWELIRKQLARFMMSVLNDKLKPNQTLHSLRHHIASSMQATGVPLAYAQAILGHSSNSITFDTYGSGVPVKALADVLKGLFKPA